MPTANPEAKNARLQRKLDRKNKHIAGLERRIAKLESALSLRSGDAVVVDSFLLRKDITKAVQDALCNVRLIPLIGSWNSRQIIEVRSIDHSEPVQKEPAGE